MWVDSQLREHVADLLFSVRTARSQVRVRLLYEHLSTSPTDLPLKLLGYEVRGWEAQRAERGDLAITIPVVVFNGPVFTAPRLFGRDVRWLRRSLAARPGPSCLTSGTSSWT